MAISAKKTERIIPRPVAGRPFANKTSFKFVVDDYNEYFLNQLFELLTEYGPIHEVWFDGAHPKTKGGQTYDYLAWKELIRTLAPEAVIFGRQDIRWGGNESGRTRKKEWNVIPYAEDPNQMNNFKDITGEDVASLEKLYQAKFLHYQPSEINTSIREGWFYRNDTEQGVRSADDVFDMYERSVGGNSVFLLNIPPNIDGLFGQRDTEALVEAGRRIKATYRKSLLATASGSKEVLDQNDETYIEIDELGQELIFELEKSTKINRFMIQEAIRTHGERIAAYELLAEIDGQWKLVATGDNVGYKDIVRFPEVSTRKLKLVILESRWLPVAISEVGAFHYASRPPQLEIERSLEGLVKISPAKGDFGWKTYEQDIAGSLNQDLEIRYTLDGSEPNSQSIVYKSPFDWQHGDIRAAAFSKGEQGPVNSYKFGIVKKEWKVLQVSSELEGKEAGLAIDAKENSYWKSQEENAALSLDLGAEYEMTGFTYLPPAYDGEGMIEQGEFWISTDGNHWEKVQDFEFGNLINDPTERHHLFNSKIKARFIKIQATRIAGGHGHTTIAEIDVLID
jgi:alpha-L-fucosidase